MAESDMSVAHEVVFSNSVAALTVWARAYVLLVESLVGAEPDGSFVGHLSQTLAVLYAHMVGCVRVRDVAWEDFPTERVRDAELLEVFEALERNLAMIDAAPSSDGVDTTERPWVDTLGAQDTTHGVLAIYLSVSNFVRVYKEGDAELSYCALGRLQYEFVEGGWGTLALTVLERLHEALYPQSRQEQREDMAW